MSRVLPISLVVTLMAASAVRSISVWAALPARMASHFGPSGQPDGWQDKASFFLLFGITGFGSALLLLVIPALLRFMPPQLINIPYREHWLAPERIEQARAKLAGYSDWFSVATTLLLAVTLELALRANLNGTGLDERAMLASLAAFVVFTIAWLVSLYRGFRP
jgi:uncharacterized membrane protein